MSRVGEAMADGGQALLGALTRGLAREAARLDETPAWPAANLELYTRLGGWRWGVPAAWGGLERSPAERLRIYVAAARGDMSTALFITQHDGAVDLLAASTNEPLKEELLPRFARGETLASIGYSQLTTSRQGGAPALVARREGGGWRLEGLMPWVTGAPRVQWVAAGAVTDDGRQILAMLPMERAGIVVEPPAPLLALNSTETCVVRCRGVRVEDELLVGGPVANVLAARSPVRSLLVSATGIGLLQSIGDALEALAGEAPPPWPGARASLARRGAELLERLDGLACGSAPPQAIDALRVGVNDALLRGAGVLMVAGKGTGFLAGHTPQRLLREAAFFAVWSANESVRAATVEALLA